MTPQTSKPDLPVDPPGHDQVQVTVEDGDKVTHKTIAATATAVPELLAELGLDGDLVLWLKRHGERSVIDIHTLFTPQHGDRFIAVRGGGVS